MSAAGNNGPSVPVSADKVATGLEEWLIEELKGRTARYFELGKFFFSVSTGILVFFATALKALGLHACGTQWLTVTVVFAVLGIVCSTVLVWPRNTAFGPQLDAVKEFNAIMLKQRRIVAVWTLCSVVALVAGLLSLIEVRHLCLLWGQAI